MKEIFRLKEMLEKENIPFEFVENEEMEGYQIAYPKYYKSTSIIQCDISVVQHKYSYGNDDNLLEIWDMRNNYDVEGYLSAEFVFERIRKRYEASYKQVKDGEIDE